MSSKDFASERGAMNEIHFISVHLLEVVFRSDVHINFFDVEIEVGQAGVRPQDPKTSLGEAGG